MAKITKKAKKVEFKKIEHKTDWKFLSIIAALTIIGVGVFLIFRGLAAQNPEIFYGYPRGHHLNTETIKAKADGTRFTPGNNVSGGRAAPGAQGSAMNANRFNSIMNSRAADNRESGATNGQMNQGRSGCNVGVYNPEIGRCVE